MPNIDLHRRARVLSPAAQLARRTLRFVGNILNGPPQPAKTLLKWHHGFTKYRHCKRKTSYPEQIRHMTGERESLSTLTKRARLVEIMDYPSDRVGLAEAIERIPAELEDFQDLGTHMDLKD